MHCPGDSMSALLLANTQRNKQVIITSKRRFDVIITCLLRFVFAGLSLPLLTSSPIKCLKHKHVLLTSFVHPRLAFHIANGSIMSFLFNTVKGCRMQYDGFKGGILNVNSALEIYCVISMGDKFCCWGMNSVSMGQVCCAEPCDFIIRIMQWRFDHLLNHSHGLNGCSRK